MSSSSPSIFDRLSKQGTVASKQREAEEKQTRLKNEQRRRKEMASLTPTKNFRKLEVLQRSPVPQDRSTKKNVVCSPKQRDALYDRLAKQETISSAAHHYYDNRSQNNVGGCHPLTKSPIRTDSELAETFNRLYKHGTASSKGHRHKPEGKSPSTAKKRVTPTPPPSLLTRRLDFNNTSSGSSGPPIPLKMDVYIRNTEEKKNGTCYNTLDLVQKDVRKQINLFSKSNISARSLAYDIINALFHRDFTPGRHWQISPATLEELDVRLDETLLKDGEEKGDNFQVFEVMKEAVNHKNVYIVARSSARIKISSSSVYVDEYSYCNDNDDAKNMANGMEMESKKGTLAAMKKHEGAAFERKQEEKKTAAAAATKKADEEAVVAKKAQEEAAVAVGAAAAAKKTQEDAAAAAKKAQEEAAAVVAAAKKAQEEAVAAKKAQEEAAAAAAAKEAQEEAAAAAAAKEAEEEAAAAKKAQEEADAARKAGEEAAVAAAAKKAQEETVAAKKAQEEAAAVVAAAKKAKEEAVAAKKAQEEAAAAAAAAKKAQEEATAVVVAAKKAEEEAAKEAEEEAAVAAAAKNAEEEATAAKKAEEEAAAAAAASKKAEEEAAAAENKKV
jgi:hypothetical protein